MDPRPAGVPSGPGLPGWSVLFLLVGLALAGAVVDLITGTGLRDFYGAGLLLGCGLGAALVRWDDKMVPVFAPPLVFTGVALVASLKASHDVGRTLLGVDTAGDTFVRLIDQDAAPWLIGGVLLAVLIIGLRTVRRRRA